MLFQNNTYKCVKELWSFIQLHGSAGGKIVCHVTQFVTSAGVDTAGGVAFLGLLRSFFYKENNDGFAEFSDLSTVFWVLSRDVDAAISDVVSDR